MLYENYYNTNSKEAARMSIALHSSRCQARHAALLSRLVGDTSIGVVHSAWAVDLVVPELALEPAAVALD